jgi:diphthamide synthase (EF-2-diphthine--ammonia ligase)
LKLGLRNKLIEIMNLELQRKLVVIFFDKFFIGALIFFAGALLNSAINRGLEKYKLIEAVRVTDTSEVVKACAELWIKAYEYESMMENIDGLKSKLSLLSKYQDTILGDTEDIKKEISELDDLRKNKLNEFFKVLDERRFVIGDMFFNYFFEYIRHINLRSGMKEIHYPMTEEQRKGLDEEVERLNKIIASMRFDALTARELAISRVPPKIIYKYKIAE